MPGRAVKTQKHAVTGKYVSAKSKTGNPQCSQAMSTWVRGRSSGSVPAEVFAILGKCRAQAHALKAGHHQRLAGNEAAAQVLEHRAATGKVGAKNRSELAARLRAQRAAKQSPSKPSLKDQVQAHREKIGLGDKNVRLRKSIDLKQGLNARHEKVVHEKDKFIDSVHKDLTTRSQDLRDTSGAKYLKSSAEKALGDRNKLAKERGLPERGPLDFKPKALKRTVHEAIHELSGGKPGTKVSIDKLKSHIKNVHKKEIDTALQHLAKKGHVTIHEGRHVTAQRPEVAFDRATKAKRLIEQRKAKGAAQAKTAVNTSNLANKPLREKPKDYGGLRSARAGTLKKIRSDAKNVDLGIPVRPPSQHLSADQLKARGAARAYVLTEYKNASNHLTSANVGQPGHTSPRQAKSLSVALRRSAKAALKEKDAPLHEITNRREAQGIVRGGMYRRNEAITKRVEKIKAEKAAKQASPAPATPRAASQEGYKIHLTGNTYAHRDHIKSLGARWSGEHKAWVIDPNDHNTMKGRGRLSAALHELKRKGVHHDYV